MSRRQRPRLFPARFYGDLRTLVYGRRHVSTARRSRAAPALRSRARGIAPGLATSIGLPLGLTQLQANGCLMPRKWAMPP